MQPFRIALLIICSSLLAPVASAEIPQPQHPIEECRKNNDADKTACLKASWNEYKNAILEEYQNWKEFEPAAESGNEFRVNSAIRTAMEGGWYIHNHWEPITPEADEFDVISFDEAEAIFDCRSAIINLKFWLIATTSDNMDASSPRNDYKQSAKKCERGIKKYKFKAH